VLEFSRTMCYRGCRLRQFRERSSSGPPRYAHCASSQYGVVPVGETVTVIGGLEISSLWGFVTVKVRWSPDAMGHPVVLDGGTAAKVKGLTSLSGDNTTPGWYMSVTPTGRFAASDMLVFIQLAMYIWQEGRRLLVFQGTPQPAPSSLTSRYFELATASGRLPLGRNPKFVPAIVTGSGGCHVPDDSVV
jgi:hypothetical protein